MRALGSRSQLRRHGLHFIVLASLASVLGAGTTPTTYVSVPSAAFGPIGSTQPVPTNVEQRIGYVRSFDGQPACVGAPVQLPDGSRVVGLEAGFTDSHTGFDVGIELRRRRVGTGAFVEAEVMASVASAAAPGVASYSTTDISTPVIDNVGYVYFVVSDPCPVNVLAIRGVIFEIEENVAIFFDDFETGDTMQWSATTP